jgi:hypothetical protein
VNDLGRWQRVTGEERVEVVPFERPSACSTLQPLVPDPHDLVAIFLKPPNVPRDGRQQYRSPGVCGAQSPVSRGVGRGENPQAATSRPRDSNFVRKPIRSTTGEYGRLPRSRPIVPDRKRCPFDLIEPPIVIEHRDHHPVMTQAGDDRNGLTESRFTDFPRGTPVSRTHSGVIARRLVLECRAQRPPST